ncbi:hypothetical protein F7725_024626 [Dissostichus mawsoni]|uniref:Uncharacterized protein n=1 Tax=Dissostichus mawsoni TaxID=36200 RepID=A0A7J5X8X1_DISMA|nr:hypothetical protein F7725_024626 [Dissostichus mawsoni]
MEGEPTEGRGGGRGRGFIVTQGEPTEGRGGGRGRGFIVTQGEPTVGRGGGRGRGFIVTQGEPTEGRGGGRGRGFIVTEGEPTEGRGGGGGRGFMPGGRSRPHEADASERKSLGRWGGVEGAGGEAVSHVTPPDRQGGGASGAEPGWSSRVAGVFTSCSSCSAPCRLEALKTLQKTDAELLLLPDQSQLLLHRTQLCDWSVLLLASYMSGVMSGARSSASRRPSGTSLSVRFDRVRHAIRPEDSGTTRG